jgi:hypothetical protein
MKETFWIAISRRGSMTVRKTRPNLNWDEIAMQLKLDIPDELFRRPHIEATLQIKDVPNEAYKPELIINTKELIEQQTGAKIDFRIVEEPKDEPKR